MKIAGAADEPRDDGTWVATTAAAEYLGVTLRTLYQLIDRGQLEAARFGRMIRLRRSSLDEYLHATGG